MTERRASTAGLLAALVVAALAAGNAPLLGEASRQVDRAARAGAVALVIAISLAVLAAGIATGVMQRIGAASDGPKPRAPWYQRLALVAATTALVCVALGGGVTITHLVLPEDRNPSAIGRPDGSATPRAAPTATADPGRRFGDAPPAWAVALLLAAGGAALALAYRRLTAAPDTTGDDEPDELDAALAAALDALRPPRDDRDAVLAAYAAMERELGVAGLRRGRAEAPREYLRRVLATGRPSGAAPARRLTALFEQARFSPAPVTAAERRAAESALEELRHAPGAAAP